MASENSVTLVGNMVDDPELRFTPNGQAMAKFRIAVNRRWMDRSKNEWQEETSFFGCTCWREQAENIASSLQKGARVIVAGRLQQRSWETPEGDKRSVVEIQVDEVGPSLRWASAEVAKNPRREGGGDWSGPQSGSGSAGGTGGANSAGGASGGGSAGGFSDDEPF